MQGARPFVQSVSQSALPADTSADLASPPFAGFATAAPDPMVQACLQRLLAMAGPMAAEFLRQLRADLEGAESRLRMAAPGPDWPEIRAQSHILIALAGTTGAAGLQRLSRALNAMAHQTAADHRALTALLAQTLQALAGLIDSVAQVQNSEGGGPR